MQFNIFNSTNLPNMRNQNQHPLIRITKAGCITFNKAFITAVQWTPDTKVSFVQDAQHPTDWYCYQDTDTGFPIRHEPKGGSCFFQSRALTDIISKSLGTEPKNYCFPMATKPHAAEGDLVVYAILTSKLKA